ncbi:interferon regulatory factor 4 [Electrophorus electricus]|uniref:IRF tryptophan pentad repeat domain-containing protein n=1 Tax=Electrophorus electricus TaxID=8005 RepID=A0A4W4H6U5_ELEEL|nr:interferon regulatory factor 4 [Electrophorus electricus]XP_026856639.1 interferon regulatory factor 4 [Electrophorus electricus]
MAGITGNGKLRQWLIEQVDTGKYPGLMWEDSEKTTFRIPWKHAGKQDYNRDEDAALFKAWALFKGKYREGIDKPDPPTWKTRLRCALNKSNDFEELGERSQLDTSDPYKVYRVIPEGTKRGSKSYEGTSTLTSSHNFSLYQAYTPLQSQVCNFVSPAERGWRDIMTEQSPFLDIHSPYSQSAYTAHWDPGYQISGSFYNCSAYDPPASLFNLDQCIRSAEALALSDPRLQVSVFNGDTLVREVTVLGVGGCRLAPYEEIQGYGIPEGPELVPLPQGEGGELEHGVLIWMAPDGLCARRLCDARVYWEGTHVPYTDKPGKLERDQISKLLDTQLFLTELQCCYLQTRPPPRFQVVLFFEESQGTHTQRRSITVQVEPLFARQLLLLSQQTNTNPVRAHEPPLWDQPTLPQHDLPATSSHQPHGYGAQDWLHPTQAADQQECKRDGDPAGYRTRPA